MERRALGTTGLEVTPIGLGLAALGRPGYINLGHGRDLGEERSVPALRQHAHAVLGAAHDVGIRYLDAARSYGRAEDFLADWLATRPDAGVTIGSKWGYTYTADWQVDADVHEVKDHSLATLERQLDETRERLGDHVDLYQVHSATLATGVLEDDAVLARLAGLAEQGVVVGLTLSGPEQAATLERALAVELDGTNPFRCVQATWNLLERSVGPALRAAHDAGWGVVVKEAVANGRLTPRGDVAGYLRAVAERHGATVDAVALAAVLRQPFVDVALSGATTVAQLTANVAALEVDLTDDDMAALEPLAEAPPAYWDRRGRLAWT